MDSSHSTYTRFTLKILFIKLAGKLTLQKSNFLGLLWAIPPTIKERCINWDHFSKHNVKSYTFFSNLSRTFFFFNKQSLQRKRNRDQVSKTVFSCELRKSNLYLPFLLLLAKIQVLFKRKLLFQEFSQNIQVKVEHELNSRSLEAYTLS